MVSFSRMLGRNSFTYLRSSNLSPQSINQYLAEGLRVYQQMQPDFANVTSALLSRIKTTSYCIYIFTTVLDALTQRVWAFLISPSLNGICVH